MYSVCYQACCVTLIELTLVVVSAALEAMTDMPPRSEEELDPVTLHNQVSLTPVYNSTSHTTAPKALLDMEDDVTATVGFEKLQFLLTLPTSPPGDFDIA